MPPLPRVLLKLESKMKEGTITHTPRLYLYLLHDVCLAFILLFLHFRDTTLQGDMFCKMYQHQRITNVKTYEGGRDCDPMLRSRHSRRPETVT